MCQTVCKSQNGDWPNMEWFYINIKESPGEKPQTEWQPWTFEGKLNDNAILFMIHAGDGVMQKIWQGHLLTLAEAAQTEKLKVL